MVQNIKNNDLTLVSSSRRVPAHRSIYHKFFVPVIWQTGIFLLMLQLFCRQQFSSAVCLLRLLYAAHCLRNAFGTFGFP